jgi:hypothetical protein
MKNTNKISALSALFASAALSAAFLPANPASAGDFLKDVAVGAAGNTVGGAVLNNGSTVNNAIGGAATGAVVSATHDKKKDNSVGGIVQDAAVGAATNTVTGLILGNGEAGNNAISGAATGALINVTK